MASASDAKRLSNNYKLFNYCKFEVVFFCLCVVQISQKNDHKAVFSGSALADKEKENTVVKNIEIRLKTITMQFTDKDTKSIEQYFQNQRHLSILFLIVIFSPLFLLSSPLVNQHPAY